MITLPELAKRHCAAERNVLSLKGFVPSAYDVSYQYFRNVAKGERPASPNLLRRLQQAHVRLFPTEPVTLTLPNQPPVLLGLQQASQN